MYNLIKSINKIFLKKNTNTLENAVTPSDCGYSTLLEYITKVLWPTKIAQYTFQVYGFSDLPAYDWGFTCTYYNTKYMGYVIIYTHLSAVALYARGFNSSGQWTGEWKQIC